MIDVSSFVISHFNSKTHIFPLICRIIWTIACKVPLVGPNIGPTSYVVIGQPDGTMDHPDTQRINWFRWGLGPAQKSKKTEQIYINAAPGFNSRFLNILMVGFNTIQTELSEK